MKTSLLILFSLYLSFPQTPVFAQDATALVRDAVNYLRDKSSYAEAEMTIHRPEWERSSSFKVWTRGNDQTLVAFTSPAKDAGNASLILEHEMWSFSPKLKKVIKIPASMRSHAWMGSDFSYRDLSKHNDIATEYSHKLIARESVDDHPIFVIEAVPRESAAVVWGKEVLRIRDDQLIIQHEFFDQDMKLVKTLYAGEIKILGGKPYPRVIRIERADEPQSWTEITHSKVIFGVSIPERVFSLANLEDPRQGVWTSP